MEKKWKKSILEIKTYSGKNIQVVEKIWWKTFKDSEKNTNMENYRNSGKKIVSEKHYIEDKIIIVERI